MVAIRMARPNSMSWVHTHSSDPPIATTLSQWFLCRTGSDRLRLVFFAAAYRLSAFIPSILATPEFVPRLLSKVDPGTLATVLEPWRPGHGQTSAHSDQTVPALAQR